MSLNNEKKKRFRNIGHDLKPTVTVAGKGLTESVIKEIKRCLEDHELVKVKIAITDRDVRKAVVQDMSKRTKSELVQEIGKVALIYRPSNKKDIKTSNVR